MNRSELQQLTALRIRDARLLLEAHAYESAYYLAGYAVECALKACVAKQIREFDFPDRRLVERAYTHNLVQLLEVSGIKLLFEEAGATNDSLRVSWTIVRKWSEASRYAVETTKQAAHDMVAAVADEANGVVPWLKNHW
jgi:HEPN domain-containing protein